jgi:predicted sulfurtransferase
MLINRFIGYGLLFLSIYFMLRYYHSKNLKYTNNYRNKLETITIDVRSRLEYEVGHLKDAIHIPYYNIKTLEYPKDTRILIYCSSGRRSNIARNVLKEIGYTNVHVVEVTL